MDLLGGILGNVLGSALGGGATPSGSSPLGSVLGSLAGGNATQGSNLLNAVLSLVQQNGGMNGVLDTFRRNGLGAHADSWVGTGANMNVSADQLQQVLGSPAIAQIASQLGLSHQQAGSAMAQLLPELVNHFTPQGQVPDNHADLLSSALQMLGGQR